MKPLWSVTINADTLIRVVHNCQGLSGAGKGLGLVDPRSRLFFDYVRLLRYLKPKYFLLENVASMKKLDKFIITQFMGVEPIKIDSALVSA